MTTCLCSFALKSDFHFPTLGQIEDNVYHYANRVSSTSQHPSYAIHAQVKSPRTAKPSSFRHLHVKETRSITIIICYLLFIIIITSELGSEESKVNQTELLNLANLLTDSANWTPSLCLSPPSLSLESPNLLGFSNLNNFLTLSDESNRK